MASNTHRNVLVIGVGNVGAGCAQAFADAGWVVHGIDPSTALVPVILQSPPHSFSQKSWQDVSDAALKAHIKQCSEIVHAADCGNRDTYAETDALGSINKISFEEFIRRLARLRAEVEEDDQESAVTSALHVAYIGGSWTRRAFDSASTSTAEVPSVSEESLCKIPSACNPYELAKIEAHDAAQLLVAELNLSITFYDWASVVPNLAPNFTVAKMTCSALKDRQIVYSRGDFGRPLLHSVDAGRALICITEERLKEARHVARFDVVLLPGSFVSFRRFAEIVADVVASSASWGDSKAVELKGQEACTPSFLSTRCSSTRLAALDFCPDAAAAERGLRETCLAWVGRGDF